MTIYDSIKTEERRGGWKTLGSAEHERIKRNKAQRRSKREVGKGRNKSDD